MFPYWMLLSWIRTLDVGCTVHGTVHAASRPEPDACFARLSRRLGHQVPVPDRETSALDAREAVEQTRSFPGRGSRWTSAVAV